MWLQRRLTWSSSSDSRMMLDRSSFSCLATFFHFNPAPLSVSSLSKDSWVIQAVPPSDTGRKCQLRVRLTCSALFTYSPNSDLQDVSTSSDRPFRIISMLKEAPFLRDSWENQSPSRALTFPLVLSSIYFCVKLLCILLWKAT